MAESEDRFRLGPGSAAAREKGCICDPQEGPTFRVEKACPVHGLGELKAMLGLDSRE